MFGGKSLALFATIFLILALSHPLIGYRLNFEGSVAQQQTPQGLADPTNDDTSGSSGVGVPNTVPVWISSSMLQEPKLYNHAKAHCLIESPHI